MILHSSFDVNEKGHLTIADCDSVELAKTYGTPLYVLDEEAIRACCRVYKNAAERYFGEGSLPLYASKALSFTAIYKIAAQEGLGADVASPGELYTAVKAGFPMERAYFHGNNKTDGDIEMALKNKIGTIVADSREELCTISRIAGEMGITQEVMLRVTPGIDTHTHDKVRTGHVDSKFGTPIETGQAMELIKLLISLPNINFTGIHCHIGSQIFDKQPYADTAEIMASFIADIKVQTGSQVKILNLGGGFGVRYIEEHAQFDYTTAIREISEIIKGLFGRHSIPMPKILLEPGRSLVAAAGATLYTVGSVKTIPGYKSYVSVDGGMTDNPRYALYQSPYTVLIANKADKPKDFTATIAGRCCESGDMIGENMPVQSTERGDILAVLVTGAYNYSMASNYNRIPRPAMVMIKDKTPRVVVRRESYEDIVANDIAE